MAYQKGPLTGALLRSLPLGRSSLSYQLGCQPVFLAVSESADRRVGFRGGIRLEHGLLGGLEDDFGLSTDVPNLTVKAVSALALGIHKTSREWETSACVDT